MTVNLSADESRWDSDDTDIGPRTKPRPLVVLVVPSGSYRTADFLEAARTLRVDLIVASDGDAPMGDLGRSRSMTIDFERPEWSAARIVQIKPVPDAVIAADDRGVLIAAMASNLLSLRANPVAAVAATRDKAHMRALLDHAGVRQPTFALAGPGEVSAVAGSIGYPCVVKPRRLSASQGVIRVDDPASADVAEARIRAIVSCSSSDADEPLLIESFVSGPEIAVEGMLSDGVLHVLALLDKPDPLDGPFFEETMFVTPSRHDGGTQMQITELVQAATDALGLVTGPVHAEIRVGVAGPVVIEIAARSIGGLCGRSLSFGLLGESLELLILRSALSMPGAGLDRAAPASGVLMVPIRTEGILDSIGGVEDALAVPGVTSFSQTIPNGKKAVPLPEGNRYLGFVFAAALTADAVEQSLREAYEMLEVRFR